MVATEQTWYIAHDGSTVFHHGVFGQGDEVITGQPNFETFDNEEDWIARKTELGILEAE